MTSHSFCMLLLSSGLIFVSGQNVSGQNVSGQNSGNLIASRARSLQVQLRPAPFSGGLRRSGPPEVSELPEPLRRGVMVEAVARNSEGEKAGLRAGDRVFRWTRAGRQGEIESPFDLSAIEIEQAPQGHVTLQGLRGTEQQVWTLGEREWDIATRPVLPESLLSAYLEGQSLAQEGKPDEAAARWTHAAGEAQKYRTPWLCSWLLFHAAQRMADLRQWKEADGAFQAVLRQAGQASPGIAVLLLRAWGQAFQARNQWAPAKKYYRQSVAVSRKLVEGRMEEAATLRALASIARLQNDFAKSETHLRAALAIHRNMAPNSLAAAADLNSLGAVMAERGDLAQAEEYYRRSLAMEQELDPGSLELANLWDNLGYLAWQRGDLTTARKYIDRALAIQEDLAPNSLDIAASFQMLGRIANGQGDLTQAEDYFGQALEIRGRAAPGSCEVASSLDNMGIAFHDRGDLATAEKYYFQALEIYERLAPGGLGVAEVLYNLGNVAAERADDDKAEKFFLRALHIKNRLAPNSLRVVDALVQMGKVAQSRGDLSAAGKYIREAFKIQKRLAPESLDFAADLNILGTLAHARGDLDTVEKFARQAWALQMKLAPNNISAVASLDALGSIAEARGQLPRAKEYYRQATSILEKISPGSMFQAYELAQFARVLHREGLMEDAAHSYERALSALEAQMAKLGGGEEARSKFRAYHVDFFSDYIDLLMRQKQPELALQVVERLRARSFLERLVAARVDIRQGIAPSLLEQEHRLAQEITTQSNRKIRVLNDRHNETEVLALTKEIERLRGQYQDVQEQIRAASPAYAALTQPRALSAKEIQEQLLDPGTLLLEYSLGPEHSYVWAVDSVSVSSFELPRQATVEAAAHRLWLITRSAPGAGETEGRRQARLRQDATTLSRMVLAPLAAQLKHKRLLIVADGALQHIPFGMLPAPQISAAGEAGAPLIAGHEVVILPSASVLLVLRRQAMERKSPPKTVAVIGDPVFDGRDARVHAGARAWGKNRPAAPGPEDGATASAALLTRSARDMGMDYLPRLPMSLREADDIMKMTPKGQGKEAVGFEASRAAAMDPGLAQYSVVYFATHALLNNRHPELSGLVLSMVDQAGRPRDGFLTLQDIYGLNLPVDLVVLSACETGLGQEIRGEGMLSLTRGFMYAGATRVVSSLWKVDDAATYELMKRFYRAMELEGLRPAAALRKAQIEMRTRRPWADPYYWAGFQIQGEWK